MKYEYFLGIDPALKNTGIALMKNDKVIKHILLNTGDKTFNEIARDLMQFINQKDKMIAGIEMPAGYIRYQNPKTMTRLVCESQRYVDACEFWGISWVTLDASEWQRDILKVSKERKKERDALATKIAQNYGLPADASIHEVCATCIAIWLSMYS